MKKAKNQRYAAFETREPKKKRGKLYALLALCSAFVMSLVMVGATANAEEIMDEFRETALDQFGPLAYRVLTEWGLKSCEDIGEMMFNLAESRRIGKDENDTHESFIGGYDFEEAFLGPYEV